MFGIPGEAPVTITPAAARRIAALSAKGGTFGLKIGLKKGGCAGMEYTMDHVDAPGANDEVVTVVHEGAEARVLIAPTAQMFLFGTVIDYEDGLLESGFRFRNPNVTEECGCGESVTFSREQLAAAGAPPRL